MKKTMQVPKTPISNEEVMSSTAGQSTYTAPKKARPTNPNTLPIASLAGQAYPPVEDDDSVPSMTVQKKRPLKKDPSLL